MNPLVWAIVLTLLPLVELRGGLPLALFYASKNNLSAFPIFILIVFLNIFLVFLIFLFLDFIHKYLLRNLYYRKFYRIYLKSMQKKIKKFETNHKSMGFFALVILVAIPLPLTGAYTGTFISWILNLDRKKSILAISLGVLIAGLIIYFGTEGIITFLS